MSELAGGVTEATSTDWLTYALDKLEAAKLRSIFSPFSTAMAVILQTGKSPDLRLQSTLVAISEDSTSCLLAFSFDL